ncbi:uncharacterized protein LOC125135441 isoform X2 [Phacochoerus africanus]|uniref:uncharacterized protein LOC125135441 isoform X2 n=1 Tax=Phacochoerus africanus TaxID=41426 RepID=UPI001FDA169C|nr:uncharacterized protein LOC125135441 isoform X2 [Phacochoerus africanus]
MSRCWSCFASQRSLVGQTQHHPALPGPHGPTGRVASDLRSWKGFPSWEECPRLCHMLSCFWFGPSVPVWTAANVYVAPISPLSPRRDPKALKAPAGANRAVQIKARTQCHCTPAGKAGMKKANNSRCWRGHGTTKNSHTAGGSAHRHNHFGDGSAASTGAERVYFLQPQWSGVNTWR